MHLYHSFADTLQRQEDNARDVDARCELELVGRMIRRLADNIEQEPAAYGALIPMPLADARDALADAMQAEIEDSDTQPSRREFLRRIIGNVRKL